MYGASISVQIFAKFNNYLMNHAAPPQLGSLFVASFDSTISRIAYILELMPDSIFTRIIKGDIPSYKIYEDDSTFAFLDIHPKQPGHTLVIPKKQVEFIWDLDETDYVALMLTVQKVAKRLRAVLGRPYVGELVEGIDVPHAHVHVYPFATTEESRHIPDPTAQPDSAALAAMAKSLVFEVY
jgi:histidine triad (HIT) family protein